MRFILVLTASFVCLSLSAQAAEPRPAAPPPTPPAAKQAAPAPKGSEADRLLERLAKAESQREARNIERQLQDLWSHSGSATADLLLERSEKALEADDVDSAREILEKLTDIAPRFAEAWYQRAALAARMDDYEEAVTALRQVLALQPKHFVAMAELATILEDFGDKEHALAAYRQAFELNPFIEGVDDRIKELSRDVEGQGI
jgi:tetratricopeptide (TPR) repeat protein